MLKVKNFFANHDALGPKTHVVKLQDFIDLVNQAGYFLGVEFRDDWQWNNCTLFCIFVLCITTATLTYTLTRVYDSLKCVELIAGFALLSTVRILKDGRPC